VEKEMGTIDTNTGTAPGPEKTTYDYTVGTESGGTTVQGNNEGFSFGTEAGEGLKGAVRYPSRRRESPISRKLLPN
jgi:hypothetical protein